MSRARRRVLLPLIASPVLPPLPAHAAEPPSRGPDLPRAARLDDLLGRLSRGASGRRDVHLVFTGKARIDNLTVEGT